MPPNGHFSWSDSYRIGIQEVDEQHQILVSLLDELHETVREQQDKNKAREIVDRLSEYTRTHFLLEESLMRLTHFPGFELHKEHHEGLIREMHGLQVGLNDDAAVTLELLEVIKDWLLRHINGEDRDFGVFFQTAGLSQYATWSNEVQTTMRKKRWWWKFW